MRNVNLAHGSLYLLGALRRLGGRRAHRLLAARAWRRASSRAALVGLLMQVSVFRFMQGQDLRQTLVTIGLSIVLADLMLWIFGGEIYTFDPPRVDLRLDRRCRWSSKFPTYRIAVLLAAIVDRHRRCGGSSPHAGRHDDPRRRRRPRHARRLGRQRAAACSRSPSRSAPGWRALPAWSAARALSISPGEDTRYLLASLVVVIVGGMGSVVGAAIGALLIGLAEQFGLAYAPTYSVVFTFVIMVLVLAFRPRGIMGRARMSAAAVAQGDELGGDRRAAPDVAAASAPARAAAPAAPRRRRRRDAGAVVARCDSRDRIRPRHVVVAGRGARLSVRRLAVLHLPDRRASRSRSA